MQQKAPLIIVVLLIDSIHLLQVISILPTRHCYRKGILITKLGTCIPDRRPRLLTSIFVVDTDRKRRQQLPLWFLLDPMQIKVGKLKFFTGKLGQTSS